MQRREFLKIGAMAAATVPFISADTSEAADVQIFVRNIEHSIDTHRLNKSAHLYINQFYHPSPMIWVWTPHGWTVQAQPVYYRSNLSFQGHLQGYHQLVQRRDNIKQITIHDADCIYILEDGTIKVYDRKKRAVTSSSVIPNYAAGLGRIDAHYRSRSR
tara:strand:+ start:21585 stop:22061 length:477 start_codon:yes stop_codon:yes gene_type:complete